MDLRYVDKQNNNENQIKKVIYIQARISSTRLSPCLKKLISIHFFLDQKNHQILHSFMLKPLIFKLIITSVTTLSNLLVTPIPNTPVTIWDIQIPILIQTSLFLHSYILLTNFFQLTLHSHIPCYIHIYHSCYAHPN